MISRAIAFESAMSLPTRRPTHTSAPLRTRRPARVHHVETRAMAPDPLEQMMNQIGCASRGVRTQRKTTSVSSTSAYELVPPPAPNAVARPTTLGACHVRLQLSMLFVPNATRLSLPARKFTSLVDLEQLNVPSAFGPFGPEVAHEALARVVECFRPNWRGGRTPFSRTSGVVRRA